MVPMTPEEFKWAWLMFLLAFGVWGLVLIWMAEGCPRLWGKEKDKP